MSIRAGQIVIRKLKAAPDYYSLNSLTAAGSVGWVKLGVIIKITRLKLSEFTLLTGLSCLDRSLERLTPVFWKVF